MAFVDQAENGDSAWLAVTAGQTVTVDKVNDDATAHEKWDGETVVLLYSPDQVMRAEAEQDGEVIARQNGFARKADASGFIGIEVRSHQSGKFRLNVE